MADLLSNRRKGDFPWNRPESVRFVDVRVALVGVDAKLTKLRRLSVSAMESNGSTSFWKCLDVDTSSMILEMENVRSREAKGIDRHPIRSYQDSQALACSAQVGAGWPFGIGPLATRMEPPC
jgi:hypothetical protein